MANTFEHHAALIDDLTPAFLRRRLNVSPQRVHNWKTRGISYEFRAAVAALAEEKGFTVPNDFLAPRTATDTDDARKSSAAQSPEKAITKAVAV